jgi:hypothetical protein
LPVHSVTHYLLIELCVIALALLAAYWKPWQKWMAGIEAKLSPFYRHPYLSFFAILAAAVLVRLALLPVEQIPHPLYHDEFSYLLAGDTFSLGRLTNPQPPVPSAFESIHINVWPTYQSMYMPGTGLLLAAGDLLGSPWVAVLLITSLFCAAVYWMVSGWLPRGYALAAGLVSLAICANFNWWFDNYFCIALPALGGALVLGSLPRIESRRDLASVSLLGIGLVILILTRPYEGFCISFPCVLVLLWKLRSAGWKKILSLSALPGAMICLTFAWLLYYNWRGTGHALLFPYMLNYRDYHITGPFLFSHRKRIPAYDHQSMRDFYTRWELTQYYYVAAHPIAFFFRKTRVYYHVFVSGFGFLLLLGAAFLLRRSPKGLSLAPLLALAGFCVQLVLEAWSPFPQYAAAAAPLFFLLIAYGIFQLRHLQLPRWNGLQFTRGLVLAEIIIAANVFGQRWFHSAIPQIPEYASVERLRVQKVLLSHPGKQLCLVRYSSDHSGLEEWVYNRADLQNARIVWARSTNPQTDRKLIAAFPGREVWLFEPDEPGQDLLAWSPSEVTPWSGSRIAMLEQKAPSR